MHRLHPRQREHYVTTDAVRYVRENLNLFPKKSWGSEVIRT